MKYRIIFANTVWNHASPVETSHVYFRVDGFEQFQLQGITFHSSSFFVVPSSQ